MSRSFRQWIPVVDSEHTRVRNKVTSDVCSMARKLILLLVIMLSTQAPAVSSLPSCPSTGPWHDCFGSRQMPNGATYVGEWKNGVRHGHGTSTRPDGQKYVGSWLADEVSGNGVATWPDGDKYEGEWLRGKFHGVGTYTFSSGKTEQGKWREGTFEGGDNFWLVFLVFVLGALLLPVVSVELPKIVHSRLNARGRAPVLLVDDEWRRVIKQHKNFLRSPPPLDSELKWYCPGSPSFPKIVLPSLPSFDTPRNEEFLEGLEDGVDTGTIAKILQPFFPDQMILGTQKQKFPAIDDQELPSQPTPPIQFSLELTVPNVPLPRVEPPLTDFRGFMRWYIARNYQNVYAELTQLLGSVENVQADHAAWLARITETNKELSRRYELAIAQWSKQKKQYFDDLKEAQHKLRTFAIEWRDFLSNLRDQYRRKTEEGVTKYYYWVLRRSPVCQILNGAEFDQFQYSPESKIIIIEAEYPLLSKLKGKMDFRGKSIIDKKTLNGVRAAVYPALSLRIAYEVAAHDYADAIDGIAINGWVDYDDAVTGHPRRAVVASLFVRKDDIASIHLENIDPIRSFDAFRGRVASADTFDVRPVEPIIKFNRNDPRFVSAREVLDSLDEGRNLAAMDWQDFEHLVRDLFSKIFSGSNAEVNVTQASRDKGVDAIVYDPTPITGGKVVIQAKRYVNVVDVSSVRDLYGTILNEGASKGVLVTTSRFGADSYEFAKDKPIELLDGANLLSLLEQHGYRMRIDLEEARRMSETVNSKPSPTQGA
jgi:restriction system protein